MDGGQSPFDVAQVIQIAIESKEPNLCGIKLAKRLQIQSVGILKI